MIGDPLLLGAVHVKTTVFVAIAVTGATGLFGLCAHKTVRLNY